MFLIPGFPKESPKQGLPRCNVSLLWMRLRSLGPVILFCVGTLARSAADAHFIRAWIVARAMTFGRFAPGGYGMSTAG